MSMVAAAGTAAAVASVASTALNIGGSLFSGWQASQNKDAINKAKSAADDVFEQQKLLAERTNAATLKRADETRDYGVDKSNLVARSTITDLNKSNQVVAKSNMAYGTANKMSGDVANNMWDAYKLSGSNLASAYQFTTESADISMEKSIAAAEKERQATLKELEGTPDSFIEGFFA